MPSETNDYQPNDSIGSYEVVHPTLDMRFLGAGAVPEPVTPPATNQPQSLYANHYYFGHSKTNSNTNSQYSPSLIARDQTSNYGHGTTSAFLASPVDYSVTYAYGNTNHAHLATPNTPLHPGSAAQSLSSTPVIPRGIAGSRNSMPQSSTHPTHGHVQQQATNHGSHHSTGSVAATVTPIGHVRSYSYNLVDPQVGLSRLSIGSQQAHDKRRPRAYSLGISSAANNAPFSTGLESSSTIHTFPAPLSSPISPDTLMSNTSVTSCLNQRQYTHALNANHREDRFPSTPLYRSSSSASMKIPASRTKCEESGNIGNYSKFGALGGMTSSEITGSSSGSLASMSRRSSPPYATRPFHPRRSSSSGSSMDLGLASGNAGIVSGLNLPNINKEHVPSSMPAVDLETSTDAEIYALCKDQRGCRFLQRKLSESDAQMVRRIFIATSPHIVTLMVDPFGNYFCQKLFENCNEMEISTLLKVASDSLPSIATNQHGTRALQRLIDSMSTSEQVAIIVNSLDGHVVRLIRDINGNHVIQKLLLSLDEYGSQFIYDAVCRSVVEIGSHRHGCCVLQRCLDYAHNLNREKSVAHIVAQALTLVCDPFGNYVCQYVIDLRVQEFTNSLVEQLLGKVAALSVQKFSSNVVEKCLRSASEPSQRAIVSESMVPRVLNELLLDNYGNYVIQTALESMNGLDAATKQEISRSICSALTVTRSPYGRRIMSKLKAW